MWLSISQIIGFGSTTYLMLRVNGSSRIASNKFHEKITRHSDLDSFSFIRFDFLAKAAKLICCLTSHLFRCQCRHRALSPLPFDHPVNVCRRRNNFLAFLLSQDFNHRCVLARGVGNRNMKITFFSLNDGDKGNNFPNE